MHLYFLDRLSTQESIFRFLRRSFFIPWTILFQFIKHLTTKQSVIQDLFYSPSSDSMSWLDSIHLLSAKCFVIWESKLSFLQQNISSEECRTEDDTFFSTKTSCCAISFDRKFHEWKLRCTAFQLSRNHTLFHPSVPNIHPHHTSLEDNRVMVTYMQKMFFSVDDKAPKSVTRALSSSEIRTLLVFISRWATFFSCKEAMPILYSRFLVVPYLLTEIFMSENSDSQYSDYPGIQLYSIHRFPTSIHTIMSGGR